VLNGLVDSHAHLDLANFNTDLPGVLIRSMCEGITAIITCGVDLSSSEKSTELAERYPEIYATAGIHPESASGTSPEDIIAIARLAKKQRVVAIGEIGLDFYHDYGPRKKQIEVFESQLGLSTELRLPVVIHARQADDEVMCSLRSWLRANPRSSPGVIHCFNGSQVAARTYIDMGFFLSLGGYITYPSSRDLRRVVERLPLDRLLLESDSPFLPPQPHRGERNEPSYITETAAELAKIKGLDVDDIARITSKNALDLFGLAVSYLPTGKYL
jgi:TatD DNase family protein